MRAGSSFRRYRGVMFGQKFIIAYDGVAMTGELKEFCRRFAIGGVILFADNYVDPDQLREQTAELQRDCVSGPQLFIGVDHEGGSVQRFKLGFTRIPATAELGRLDPQETYAIAQVAGHELARCGVNLNFAPVADVAPADCPGAIGDRAFSDDAAQVASHVAAAVAGLQGAGVMACAKHFPGHGPTDVDSHRALPVAHRSEADLTRIDLPPFASALRAGVGGIMTAHVVYADSVDPHWPASLSSYWICDVLRRRMGFDGLAFTDALEMTAIRDAWSPTEAGRMALLAGSDIIIFYLIEEQLRAVHDLCRDHERGVFDVRAVAKSLERIAAAKRRWVTRERVLEPR